MKVVLLSIYFLSLRILREIKFKINPFLRVLLIRFLNHEILIPKGFYRRSKDWVDRVKVDNIEVVYKTVYPAHVVYKNRIPLLKENYWAFNETSYKVPEAFFVNIESARVYGSSGAVITPDDYLLEDISHEISTRPERHSIFRNLLLKKPFLAKGTVASIATSDSNNYYHWIFDTLPRLHILNSILTLDELDYLIIDNDNYAFKKETIELLGIPKRKLLKLTELKHIKADRLLVPSWPGRSGLIPKWSCEYIRRLILKDNVETKYDERVYISRTSARYRKVVNENDLIVFLEKHGFKVYDFAGLAVVEQANIINQAKIVVAPHGAALTNLVFAKPGTKVLELFSAEYINYCFWNICDHLKLKYSYLIDSAPLLSLGKYKHKAHQNLTINLREFQKKIEELI